jgi:hypothetical protein
MNQRGWILCALLALGAGACDTDDDDGGVTADGGGNGDKDGSECTGLACFQVSCPAGSAAPTTTLSGTVFAPNGTLPLYNVTVFVPNGTPTAFPPGVSCDRCDTVLSGDPLVRTVSDEAGHFVLENVPATANVPLVIQVGKWRRQIVVPSVPSCVDTPLDAASTRLPRNQSEGDLPQMALTTGASDALECLLRKIGIDDAEFTAGDGAGRVHMYAGHGGAASFQAGGAFTGVQPFWSSLDNLEKYDVVFMSCEGGTFPEEKPAEATQAMSDYTDLGGRVFASHWHHYWLQQGPAPWPDTVTIEPHEDLNDITADIDQSFETGQALAKWLMNVEPNSVFGQIDITAAQHTIIGVNPDYAYKWIYKDDTANGKPSVQYLSFTTPLTVPEEERCGKFVLSDIHVSSGDVSKPETPFPTGCTTTGLTAQEKTLAFAIFDLSSCIGPVVGKPGAPGAARCRR